MKTLSLLVFIVSSISLADDFKMIEPPAYLKDADVTVTLKNGKTVKYSANEWAVVPRKQKINKAEAKQVMKAIVAAHQAKNSVRVYGGYGPSGVNVSKQGGNYTVEQDYGFNTAVGYGRKVYENVSAEGLMLFNSSGPSAGLVGVGYSF